MSTSSSLFRAVFTPAAVLLAALLAASCGDSADARELRDEAGDTLDAGADWAASTWDEFRSGADERIEKLEQELERLEERSADERAEVERRIDAMRVELESKLTAAREQLDELREGGQEQWRESSESVKQSLAEVGAGVERAWSELDGESAGGEDSDGR